MARMRCVRAVAVSLERRPRLVERHVGPLGGRAQVARDERNLGLRHDAPRLRHRMFRAKSARRLSQQRLCPDEIAQLCHRNAAKRQRRRVIAQCNPL
jgi:hypothetical protein